MHNFQREPNIDEDKLFSCMDSELLSLYTFAAENRLGITDYLHGDKWKIKSDGVDKPDWFMCKKLIFETLTRIKKKNFVSFDTDWENNLVTIYHHNGKVEYRLGKLLREATKIFGDEMKFKENGREFTINIKDLRRTFETRNIPVEYTARVFTDPLSILSCSTNRVWTSCLDLNRTDYSNKYKEELIQFVLLGAATVYFYRGENTRPIARDIWIPSYKKLHDKLVRIFSAPAMIHKLPGSGPKHQDYIGKRAYFGKRYHIEQVHPSSDQEMYELNPFIKPDIFKLKDNFLAGNKGETFRNLLSAWERKA